MRYVEARAEEDDRELTYRIYVSRSLQLIPQNKYLKKDFYEYLNPKAEDNRSGNEIVSDIMLRAGLHFEEKIDECI